MLEALGVAGIASAQTMPVVHWVNSSNATISLSNPGDTFITNFRGTNDVTVTLVDGNGPSLYDESFGGASPGNNPTYLKNYVGLASNGTGDGFTGDIQTLNMTGGSTGSLQFDFTQSLTSIDRIMLADVDYTESYTLTAYHKVGVNYVQVSTAGWTHQNYSGQTGITPDTRWPVWNGGAGTLTSNTTGGLSEPLDVLIPDNAVDRLIVEKTSGGGASTVIQIAEQIGAGLGDINFDNHVNANDIAAMMQALSNKPGYAQAKGVSTATLDAVGDENLDGKFSNADLQKLLNLLKAGGGSTSVPEPASVFLLVLGCAMLAWCGRS